MRGCLKLLSNSPRKLLIFYVWKSAGVCTVARSAIRGLRIAHLTETSNAEAHADMYICTLHSPCLHMENAWENRHTYWTSTVALLLVRLEFAKFRIATTKRIVNAFSMSSPLYQLLKQKVITWRWCKYNDKNWISVKSMYFFIFLIHRDYEYLLW